MVVALAALLLASGIFTTPKYLEPWDKEYAGKLEDPRLQLAAHGLLAASGHNAQPWKIRLDQNNKLAFLLYADSERLTLQVDPLARQTMVSQGHFWKMCVSPRKSWATKRPSPCFRRENMMKAGWLKV